ncbi:MAG: antiviral reverse transcriptase Drt3b [Terriglobia bacterium]|jgi:hypothetical protein
MKRRKKRIKYKKERAVLSDVLPYELPLTFSNHHFYEFLIENQVEFRGGEIFWKQGDEALDATIRLLVGADRDGQVQAYQRTTLGVTVTEKCLKHFKGGFASIPFGYKIRHKEDEFRELTICHPRSQLQLVNLYDSYKELILYYCRVSPFSIRRPSRIARFVFRKDRAHYQTLQVETSGVEESGQESENLRSFFVYKDYSHIFKFYESVKFHGCEKKYNRLLKLDISKCFDSVYTHSLQWALLGKGTVKEERKKSNRTFGGRFDEFMRQANYDETNGIIIGPEFSRIFAELILQSVDRAVCVDMERKHQVVHRKDYEVFRYIDDYFVFYNEEEVRDTFLQILQVSLKDYKLYLNRAKAINYEKPIITNISMAKHRIAKLLNETLKYELETVSPENSGGDSDSRPRDQKRGNIRVDSDDLITQFKTILKESEVDYKDTLNFTLAIVERMSARIIKDYGSISKAETSEKQLCQAILAVLDFTFFIYSVSPRVNTSIRLCRILQVFMAFLKKATTNKDLRHTVFNAIFENICFILNKYRSSEHTPVETLYLLIALAELGRDYWLDVEALASYFNIERKGGRARGFRVTSALNYISLVVLLFYMKEKKRYDTLRDSIEATIKGRFREKKATLRRDTELTLLLLDILACPYVKLQTKKEILRIYGIKDEPLQEAIIAKRKYWFTKWTDLDFGEELDAKQSQEVY